MSMICFMCSSAERVEEDDLVDAVEQLRPEMRPQRLGHLPPDAFRQVTGVLGDELAADVRRHDHHGVLEVHRAALAVGQPPVVEELQQHVEHFRVRLLDLVEQHDGVRTPPDRLGELAGLVVADVPGGAPIMRDTVCFSWYSDMSIRMSACSSSKRNSASARASSVLPTPVGPRNMKLPSGRFGSCRPARARRIALATAVIASSWPTTRWWRRSSM